VAASCLLLGPTRLPGGPGQLRKAVLIEEEAAGLVLKVYFPGGSKQLAAPIPAHSALVCLLRITVTETYQYQMPGIIRGIFTRNIKGAKGARKSRRGQETANDKIRDENRNKNRQTRV